MHARSDNFPILERMSLARVTVEARGFREPRLSGSVGMLTPNVMGNTWGWSADLLAGLPKGPEDMFAGKPDGTPDVAESASYPNQLKLDLEGMSPRIDNVYGKLKTARLDTWPVLDELAMYSLRIERNGMREPHWHPITAELGHVHTGRARMTVKSADGSVDTYRLGPGDVYFIPRGFPHHIENLEDEETHFLVFFDRETPRRLAATASPGAREAPWLGAGRSPGLTPAGRDRTGG